MELLLTNVWGTGSMMIPKLLASKAANVENLANFVILPRMTEMFFAWYRGGRSGEPTYPHKRSQWLIEKKRLEESMTVYDHFDGQFYQYADALLSPSDWVIADSVANINGYDCVLATCSYHGRDWSVWFSTDLPCQDGPWKFCGLPGLVVSASDTEGLYQFDLKDIYPISTPVKPWAKRPKKTSRQKFLKENFEYLRQLDGNSLTFIKAY